MTSTTSIMFLCIYKTMNGCCASWIQISDQFRRLVSHLNSVYFVKIVFAFAYKMSNKTENKIVNFHLHAYVNEFKVDICTTDRTILLYIIYSTKHFNVTNPKI